MAASKMTENGSTDRVGLVVDDDALIRESVAAVMEDICDHV